MVIKEKIERENQISEIRNFNRFYLLRFQLLNEKPFRSEYSLAEILVLNMLAEKPNIVSSELACQLQIDDGYLSRTLKLLVRKGLVDRRRSIQDSRKWLFNLTKNGNLEQNKLDEICNWMSRAGDYANFKLTVLRYTSVLIPCAFAIKLKLSTDGLASPASILRI